jgi:hypothetical protein
MGIWRKLLIIICFYQIFSSLITLGKFVYSLTSFSAKNDYPFLIILVGILLTGLAIFFIYTNFYLLIKKGKGKMFVTFNKWINFFQIIQVSIFGFIFYFVIGPTFMPYFCYKEDMRLLFEHDTFQLRFALSFASGNDDIEVGINIIPLILFVLWDFILRKHFTSKNELSAHTEFLAEDSTRTLNK